ncbi:peptidase inhibitor family I36 protein [Streptomyces sp. NPDC004609]|uniref:peptidase inhibitor family I36 protein n=1 Tax=Streptomyces sp. NPDC004609 TaxID=3364704 RepID=UPI0036A3EEB6
MGLVFAPSAAADKSDCPEEHICVWDNGTYSGSPAWQSTTDLYDLYSASGLSIVNNTSSDLRFKVVYRYVPRETWMIGCLYAPPATNAHAFPGNSSFTLAWTQVGVIC